MTPNPTATPKQASCEKVESRLYGLTVAGDPSAYAANNRLHYVNGSVRAIIELGSQTDSLPAGYAVTVEAKQGAMVQALVPVSDLCNLSNEPEVRFVRAPIEAVR